MDTSKKSLIYQKLITDKNGKRIYLYEEINRNDTDLIAVVKLLGDKADGDCAKLRIETFEWLDNIDELIDSYDGKESITNPCFSKIY